MTQDELVRIETYARVTSVVFLKTKEKYGGLSNMAAGFPLRVNGIDIRTSEALYQACRFPDHPDVQRLILEQKSPMAAKNVSKPHRAEKCRADWDAVMVEVMRWCLRVKLAKHLDEFGALLWITQQRPLVEETSKRDVFWGAKDRGDGSLVGSNVLGKLLMELREEFNSGDRNRLKTVQPLTIADFRLMGEEIGEVG